MSRKKQKSDNAETTLLIQKLPTQLKADFKAACAQRNMTIREAIKGFMKDFIHITPGAR